MKKNKKTKTITSTKTIMIIRIMSIIFILFVFIIIVTKSTYIYAKENINIEVNEAYDSNNANDYNGNIVKQYYHELGLDSIVQNLEKYSDLDKYNVFPELDVNKVIENAKTGNLNFSPLNILKSILKFLINEVRFNIGILAKIVIISLICSFIRNLRTSFMSEGISEAAFFVCYMVIIGLLMQEFSNIASIGKNAVDNMCMFINTIIPLFGMTLAASGYVGVSITVKPLLIMISAIFSVVMKNIILPLVYISTVTAIVNTITKKIHISKLAQGLKQASTWLMGFILTIFIALITTQSTISASIDGVTGKTVKYAVRGLVPVAGRYLSEAADTIAGCSIVVKNAAGIGIMVCLILICAGPALKLLSMMVVLKIAGIIVEPVTDERITSSIGEVANSIGYIFGICVCVSIMFLISSAVIINASSFR